MPQLELTGMSFLEAQPSQVVHQQQSPSSGAASSSSSTAARGGGGCGFSVASGQTLLLMKRPLSTPRRTEWTLATSAADLLPPTEPIAPRRSKGRTHVLDLA